LLQLLQVLRRSPLGRDRGRLDLEETPRLDVVGQQLGAALAAEEASEHVGVERVPVALGQDRRPATVLHRDDAALLQSANALARDPAADPMLLRDVGLARQEVTRLVTAVDDLTDENLHRIDVEARHTVSKSEPLIAVSFAAAAIPVVMRRTLIAAGAVSAAAVVVLAQLRGPAVDIPTAVVLVAALGFFARTAIGLAADSPRRDVDRPS
jgi:hypothetical protein